MWFTTVELQSWDPDTLPDSIAMFVFLYCFTIIKQYSLVSKACLLNSEAAGLYSLILLASSYIGRLCKALEFG